MIGELKGKRLKQLRMERETKEKNREIVNNSTIFDAKQNLAMSEDIDKRFGDYNKDVSVGNMYQRKAKKTNAKADASDEFLKGVLNVTKAAVIGGIGMGIIGSIGAMARKKKSAKPKQKRKKCGCNK
jgi:hypothetical protein